MTAVDDTAPATAELDAAAHDHLQVLDAIQSGALRLLGGFPRQPSTLRIRVGEVTVEAHWPQQDSATAPTTSETVAVSDVPAPSPTIRAPSVGVFYRSPEPGADPFVDIGDHVTAGQQVAIVEAMKLMIPVTAEAGGVITEICKQDGESVQFDDPLFSYSAG
ncbi:acetyl-CoA carboxylase biotin carboxyl carrier protein [Nocardia mexicana]|uniref:Biotin carboxyl carrier protein of acetyl-CoA carboxylase n=1 Tax=Nocardia mexicana TaxID=279262 RepID=A0A370GL04_9NOCA|nr:acetyl-CoA carboxylase biotin carboxyl carrier protein subunit [Nocardia mexicana]RDI44405.1 acetyl-CoA carboxylase biotin carboxyl carrier protein [Nocardia mexicana]